MFLYLYQIQINLLIWLQSKEEKAEYFKKQLDELKNSIEDKIEDFLKNSEELKAFICFKNKHFRTYSFRNSLLIYNQFPNASYVALGNWLQYIPEFKLSGDGFWIYKAQADEFKKNGKVELDGIS